MRYPWHIISDLSAFKYIHVRDCFMGGMGGDGFMGKMAIAPCEAAVGGQDVPEARNVGCTFALVRILQLDP